MSTLSEAMDCRGFGIYLHTPALDKQRILEEVLPTSTLQATTLVLPYLR